MFQSCSLCILYSWNEIGGGEEGCCPLPTAAFLPTWAEAAMRAKAWFLCLPLPSQRGASVRASPGQGAPFILRLNVGRDAETCPNASGVPLVGAGEGDFVPLRRWGLSGIAPCRLGVRSLQILPLKAASVGAWPDPDPGREEESLGIQVSPSCDCWQPWLENVAFHNKMV